MQKMPPLLYLKNKGPIKLRTMLLISYIVLILVPFGFYTVFSFSSISKSGSEQLNQAADQVLKQTKELLDYKLGNIIYASDQLFYDETMNKTIKRDRNLSISPQLLEDLNTMKALISNAFNYDDMHRLILYLDSSIYYSNSFSISGDFKSLLSNIPSISSEDWYKKLQSYDGKVLWLEPSAIAKPNASDETVISCVRFVKDMDNYNNILGILRIDLLQNDLNSIVEKAVTTDHGASYLLNSDGHIIASSNIALAEKYNTVMRPGELDSIRQGSWYTDTVDHNSAVIGTLPIKNTDWLLVSIIPYEDIQGAGWDLIKQILFSLLLIVPLSGLLSIASSYTITSRLHTLSKKMMGVRNETLPEPMEEKGFEEICTLIRSYNYMIEEIKQFSETQYNLGKDVQNAELKALQAQIDPHFLYNTLELVNWVALRNNVPKISDIVQKLTKYYKLSLSKGKDVISLQDEIERIKTYVNLQNLRFRDRIHLVIEIEESLYQCGILKLILQPIVENAIFHGIFEKELKTGTITITGEEKDSALILSIRDDGVGMNREKVEKLFFSNRSSEEQGYGIINVNHRIKLFYGNDYGMTCQSVIGTGTVVNICIPAVPTN